MIGMILSYTVTAMPNPDLRKDKFFRGKDPKEFLKNMRDKANKLRAKHANKSRSERLMELQNTAVESCLVCARSTLEVVTGAADWDANKEHEDISRYIPKAFNQTYYDYGEPTWRELTEAVAREVRESLVSWGFRSVVVRPENRVHETDGRPTGVCAIIHIKGLVKSLLNDTEKNSPAAAPAPSKPPAPRTGLIGQCTICLEEKTKLLAFIPCGHTCLRNKYRTMSKRHTNFHQVSFESRTKLFFW